MKNPAIKFLIVFIILFVTSVSLSYAQMRDQKLKRSDYSGPIMRKNDPSDGANIGNLFNMKMSHSYSINFASVGGHAMNVNAYTNSMEFFFTPKLTGQVDVSLLHSPFGPGPGSVYAFKNDNENKLQVALDAQLDYQISKNMNLHFEVNRAPGGYGYYPGSFGSPLQRVPYRGY